MRNSDPESHPGSSSATPANRTGVSGRGLRADVGTLDKTKHNAKAKVAMTATMKRRALKQKPKAGKV
jgi:hypothetical protein